ncbi:hypothetical protein OGM63_20525 [Plectonema radiosum NIES-515]|uniref:Uncharacterized protein n=1 Tax=Plectonema radiosum NIES-515 TaxID=2986073 RepID=A0ABT3B3C1_9CYAN|nr:hypothetical protein [Plectonema radiosum]MCV3215864.1 hypothetical protein [Plectonema radiosum NIES-515]
MTGEGSNLIWTFGKLRSLFRLRTVAIAIALIDVLCTIRRCSLSQMLPA